jgi:hypothetical protein
MNSAKSCFHPFTKWQFYSQNKQGAFHYFFWQALVVANSLILGATCAFLRTILFPSPLCVYCVIWICRQTGNLGDERGAANPIVTAALGKNRSTLIIWARAVARTASIPSDDTLREASANKVGANRSELPFVIEIGLTWRCEWPSCKTQGSELLHCQNNLLWVKWVEMHAWHLKSHENSIKLAII